MINRRRLLSTVAGVATVSLAGCALLGDEIEAESSPARVSDGARSETGYEHKRTEDKLFEQTVEIGGEQRDISLTNWVSEYTKLPRNRDEAVASFLVFTTPTVSVAGRAANPFQRFDEKQVLRALTDRSDRGQPSDTLEEVGTRSVEALGNSVEFTQYETSQEVAGRTIDVLLHLGTLTNDGDLLAILGSHPAPNQNEGISIPDESENIYRLGEGIEHPSEA